MASAMPAPNPEEMAIYDQMRQNISPKEFSDEMLAGGAQVDPQAVAEFRAELDALEMPPEILDALNNLVDEIMANPQGYAEIREKYMAQGIPEDILPEQFDPQFFAALNMAIDQLIAEPAGVQAFAKGGIAELKPIAKAIASYGRNGDTMLAHITPAEARMLKRRGGSGTINPHTGLPEFANIFKKIGRAVKKFANSTVGRIITTVALGFFLGPAAASMLGVSSVAGVAAVSGFVGSAGSTLLGGGNLRDALKAGVVGGVTAGATAGVTSGFDTAYAGPTTVSGQVDAFKGMLPGGAPPPSVQNAPTAPPVDAAAPTAPGGAPVPVAQQFPAGDPGAGFEPSSTLAGAPDATASQGSLAKPAAGSEPSLLDQGKDIYNRRFSPSGIQEAGAQDALLKTQQQFGVTAAEVAAAPAGSPMAQFYKSQLPGVMGTYGPMAAAGLGIMGLTGGFKADSGQGITAEDRKGPMQRMRDEGSQRQYFVQGLPGVKYDQSGEPIYGESVPFTTQDPSRTFALPQTVGGIQGVAPPMAMYSTPEGAIGGGQVAQPYNTAFMYSNLMPRQYADGGAVQYFSDGGRVLPEGFSWETYLRYNPDLRSAGINSQQQAEEHYLDYGAREGRPLTPEDFVRFNESNARARAEREAQQAADRAAADAQRALRRSQGSGTMYANINAGIGALAPEVNPMDPTDITFGARNRQTGMTSLQTAYGPMLQNQRDSMARQAQILGASTPSGGGGGTPPPGGGGGTPPPGGGGGGGGTPPPPGSGGGGGWTPSPSTTQDTSGFVVGPGDTGVRRSRFAGLLPEGTTMAMDPRTGLGNTVTTDGVTRPYSPVGGTMYTNAERSAMKDSQDLAARKARREAQAAGIAAGTIQVDPAAYPFVITEGDGKPGPVSNPSFVAPIYNPAVLPTAEDREKFGFTSPYASALANPSTIPLMSGETQEQGVARIKKMNDELMARHTRREEAKAAPRLLNMGGIAALAQGGYPRRTGQISGPGTEKSDSIPAMLSDGEFVMTAKAVRGAGKGNRRAGAKQMYKLMHQLEKNSERG
jgi:hypothetical protein